MHLTPCVCNKILAPLYAGQTISSTLTPWSAAELTTPHGTNTTNRFTGQNKSKISFNVHADSYLPKKKQNLVLSNQHAVLRYQPNKKTKLRSLQSASWLSSIRKLLTSTPKATTQEQGKSWLCPLNIMLSNGKNQTCTHQSASWLFSRKQSVDGHVKAGKAFTQKVAFERLTTKHLDPQQCQSALVTTKKKILLEADHSFIYLPKKKPNVVLSNQHAGLSYQPKTKTKFGSLQSSRWISSS